MTSEYEHHHNTSSDIIQLLSILTFITGKQKRNTLSWSYFLHLSLHLTFFSHILFFSLELFHLCINDQHHVLCSFYIKGQVHPKNENSVIIFSSQCWWKVGWSFDGHKLLLALCKKNIILLSSWSGWEPLLKCKKNNWYNGSVQLV